MRLHTKKQDHPMNTMVKGLRYTKRDRAAWHNDFQQHAKVASHLGEPSARLDVLYLAQSTFWHVSAF